jgi:hypothetical protein
MEVTDHEADAEGKVKSLKNPNGTRQDHRDADQAADDAHHDVKCSPHGIPRKSPRAQLKPSKAGRA